MSDQLTSHGEQVRQLFDAKAADWSAKYQPHGRLTGRLTSLADAVRAQVTPGSRVLDLGCGTGELARVLAGAGMQVTACDISAAMLHQAIECDAGRSVRWIQLEPDWRVLPLEAAAQDAVIASSLLEYVDNPAQVLAECARVVRTGGNVLCTVPDTQHWIRRLERPARALARGRSGRVVSRTPLWLANYVHYLQVSRQRHPGHWWIAAASSAGLHPSPAFGMRAEPSPLRLFVLERFEDSPAEDT